MAKAFSYVLPSLVAAAVGITVVGMVDQPRDMGCTVHSTGKLSVKLDCVRGTEKVTVSTSDEMIVKGFKRTRSTVWCKIRRYGIRVTRCDWPPPEG